MDARVATADHDIAPNVRPDIGVRDGQCILDEIADAECAAGRWGGATDLRRVEEVFGDLVAFHAEESVIAGGEFVVLGVEVVLVDVH